MDLHILMEISGQETNLDAVPRLNTPWLLGEDEESSLEI